MEVDANSIEPGKIFVGGLSWDTTQENLKAYFEKFGEVSDTVIMKDPISQKPRGFGFVTFKDPAKVKAVCDCPIGTHTLDSKTIDPKPATMKSATGGPGATGTSLKKIFVGGIAHGTTEDEMRSYFSAFGTVTEVDLKYDKNTGRMRGFGFVGFDDQECADKICCTQYHTIKGKTVEVKKAEPRQSATPSGFRGGGMGGGQYPQAQPHHHNSYGGYGRGANYPNYGYGSGYGYGGQQQQYGAAAGYNYGAQGYGGQYGSGQNYGAYNHGPQGAATGQEGRTDYNSAFNYDGKSHFTEAATGVATGTGQQQMGNYQENSTYPRSSYNAGGTDNFAQQQTYDYNSYPQYSGETQAGYGRGGGGAAPAATQQRSYQYHQH